MKIDGSNDGPSSKFEKKEQIKLVLDMSNDGPMFKAIVNFLPFMQNKHTNIQLFNHLLRQRDGRLTIVAPDAGVHAQRHGVWGRRLRGSAETLEIRHSWLGKLVWPER